MRDAARALRGLAGLDQARGIVVVVPEMRRLALPLAGERKAAAVMAGWR